MFESSTVFASGLAFTTMTLLYLSVKMSRLSQEHQILTRELALLRHEVERDRDAVGESTREPCGPALLRHRDLGGRASGGPPAR